ncbi:hypothetical protein T4C_9059, partial [Trichinella pseudospiralis]
LNYCGGLRFCLVDQRCPTIIVSADCDAASLSSGCVATTFFRKNALTITSHKADKMFPSTMAQVEEEAWVAFTNVVSGFLGKKKDPEYGRLVNDMLENFEKLGCNLNLKLYFLHLHLFFFTESWSMECSKDCRLLLVSEEQNETESKEEVNLAVICYQKD